MTINSNAFWGHFTNILFSRKDASHSQPTSLTFSLLNSPMEHQNLFQFLWRINADLVKQKYLMNLTPIDPYWPLVATHIRSKKSSEVKLKSWSVRLAEVIRSQARENVYWRKKLKSFFCRLIFFSPILVSNKKSFTANKKGFKM